MSPREFDRLLLLSFPRVVIFELHQGLSECPVGAEADSDVQGGKYPAYGLGQMVDMW